VLTPIIATLVYVVSPDRSRILMLHRNKRTDDIHFGKYNGLGGKVEPDEDVVSGAIREVYEESGLVVDAITLRGTVSWPGFGRNGQDWFGFVFRVDAFTGTPHDGNDEGTLEWTPIEQLPSLPMWESDHEWLPMALDDDPRTFHGVMPYHDGNMVSWSYHRI
jgi:8-oxo-dGTP diphosphatase